MAAVCLVSRLACAGRGAGKPGFAAVRPGVVKYKHQPYAVSQAEEIWPRIKLSAEVLAAGQSE
jgi:hypothetical protein